MPKVTFGAISEINNEFYKTEFKFPTDGQMGLMLSNLSGSGRNTIPSPMFGLVANAEKPVITIYQKPFVYNFLASIFGLNNQKLNGNKKFHCLYSLSKR